MIESIYVLDTASTALVLQHTYTGRQPPTELLEYFQSLLLNDPHSQLPSILPVPSTVISNTTVLLHVKSTNSSIILLSPVTREPHDATGVIELLIRIIDVLEDYFGKDKLNRRVVESNFDIVQEILGEIVDNGEIVTAEPNALRDIVLPPSLLNKLISAAGLQGSVTKMFLTTTNFKGLTSHQARCLQYHGDEHLCVTAVKNSLWTLMSISK